MKLNGRLAERRDRVKRRWDLSVKAQANCAAQVYGRLISWDGLKSRIATIIDMQQAAFYKLLQLDAVMLFAVFGSEGSACPPLSREAQITVWIDLWTNYLEFSHWIVDLLKPSRIKVKINSSKLLFSGRRESALRATGKEAPQSQRDRNEPSMVLDCDILKERFSGRAWMKSLNCFEGDRKISNFSII